jgi:hypothetical protein
MQIITIRRKFDPILQKFDVKICLNSKMKYGKFKILSQKKNPKFEFLKLNLASLLSPILFH